MNKTFAMSALSYVLLSSFLCADENTTKSNWNGEIRGGYQYTDKYTDNSVDTTDEFGLSAAIKYESNSWNNLVFGARIAAAAGEGKTPEGISFFDANGNGYGIVDELYIKGNFGNSELTIGRQAIDLPFVDTDEGLGLIDNRFEAVVFSNKDIKDTTITLAHIRSWSGVDSDDAGKFNRINGNDGIQLAGIEYTGIANLDLKVFGYTANNFIDAMYIETAYENETDSFEYSATLQYALQDKDNEDESRSSTFGAAAELGLKSIPLGLNFAYNKNFDNGAADNLYGGGPFVTSMEHYTVADLEGKGEVVKGGVSYELVDGLSLEANYAKFDRDALLDAKELDVGLSYEVNDNLALNAAYSDIQDDENGDTKNLRANVTYKF